MITFITSSQLPTPWGVFRLHVFLEEETQLEHLALSYGSWTPDTSVLLRLHSECLTGDALFSLRCDCGPQLQRAMQHIAESGQGVILYLRQEGRGIGLLNKIRAYNLQDQGYDTVQANEHLGFDADMRRYDFCLPMLEHLGIRRVRLMTNNPRKVAALQDLGIEVTERIGHEIMANPHNSYYLQTKAERLGHLLGQDFGLPDPQGAPDLVTQGASSTTVSVPTEDATPPTEPENN